MLNENLLKHIKDIHSVSAKEGRLLYNLAKDSQGTIVEIGSWKGYSTIWLAKGSLDGRNAPIYAIDPHTGSAVHHEMYGVVDTYGEFLKNINEMGVSKIVLPMRMTSEQAVKSWESVHISLLWIDGDHTLAVKDLEMWFPYVVDGGIIALHDTTTWENPRKASILMYKSNHFKDVHRVGSITYATKTASLTWAEKLNNDDSYYKRCIYQAFLPYYIKLLTLGAKILKRDGV